MFCVCVLDRLGSFYAAGPKVGKYDLRINLLQELMPFLILKKQNNKNTFHTQNGKKNTNKNIRVKTKTNQKQPTVIPRQTFIQMFIKKEK